MATATELKTLKLKIESNTADAVTALNAVGKSIQGTSVSIKEMQTAMQLGDDGVEKYVHSLQIAARSVEELQRVQARLAKGFLSVEGNVATSNVAAESRATQKRREEEAAKAFKEESDRRKVLATIETADMVARTRAGIAEQVALNREGANSITAIKVASAERQRQIEENLKAKLQSIQQRYINQEISSSQLNLGRNASITSYKNQTLALTEETDKRINKIKEETEAVIRETKRRTDLVKSLDSEAIAKLRASMAQKIAISREGEDSITAIKTAAAEKQRIADNKLQSDLKAIQDKFIKGESSWIQQSAARNKALAEYESFVLGLNSATDRRIAKIQEAKAKEAATISTNKGIDTENIAKMNAQLAIRTAAQQKGENDISVVKLRAAEAQRQLQVKLYADLDALQQKYISGAISREKQLADSQRLMQQYQTQSLQAARGIPAEVTRTHENLLIHVGKLIISYQALRGALSQVWSGVTGIPKVGIELDSVRASLEATMGSTAGMNSALQALDRESQRTGITIGVLRDNFKGFQASTSLAGVSMDSTWRMFTNLNTVISALHLSSDKANHVFLAMSQIFNKSKVQSEELVKQLGNLLPGAFASFAKSMNIAPEMLAKQMKAGTVYAQDTMENFLQYMATKFQPAFVASMDNLNANTGRLQSSFTRLQETIYDKTAPAMNSFVKATTAVVNSINSMVKGTEELSIWLKGAFGAALGLAAIALADLVLKMETAIATSVRLKAAMLFLSNPETIAIAAIAGGIALIGSKLNEANEAANRFRTTYSDVMKIAKSMRSDIETGGKSEAELLKVKIDNDSKVIGLKEALVNLEKDLKEATPGTSGRGGISGASEEDRRKMEVIKKQIDFTKDQLKLARDLANLEITSIDNKGKIEAHEARISKYKLIQQEQEYQSEKYAKTVEEAIDRVATKFEEANAGSIKNAKADQERYENLKKNFKGGFEGGKEELDRAKQASDEATKTLTAIQENRERQLSAAAKTFNDKQEAEQNKSASKRLAGIKEEISQVRQFERTAANDAENKINELNSENDRKVLSFEDYLRRKQAILDKDYNTEKDWYEKQRELAQSSGKKGLVTQAEEQLKRLEQDYQSKSKVAADETATKMNEYETNLANIHQQYQDILGIERDSVEITKVKVELLNRQLEAEIREGEEAGAKAARIKEELVILNEAKNLKSKMAIYDKESATAEKIHGDAVSRINQLEQVGQISSLSATMARTKANERLLQIRQKDVDLAKKALDEAKPEARPASQATYDLAVQKLESLKLVANETGAMIEQSLGNAFDRSFTGLITNTMTAKQAFKSFATSIVEDIARIIAQEVRSAILRPILRMGLSALGGLFTSAAGSVGSVGDGSINLETTPFEGGINYNAKGGIYSGAGISAHSGTIVSSPTVFPFAKGVGLMGEAGPEAILPLKRNSQGKLGVSIDNTGQPRGSNIYYINTTVNAKSDASPTDIANKTSETIMRAIAKQEINSAARPGNRLNQVTKYG
jgi:tape measure domain-containing protein